MRAQPSAFLQWTLLALGMRWSWADRDYMIVKPGICPQYHYGCFGKHHFNTTCTDDGDCKGSQKCCSHRCEMSCAAAVLVKIGRCPPDVSECQKPAPKECEQDFDCLDQQKCCKTKCGAKCKNPSKFKAGDCPVKTSLCSPSESIKLPKCSSDDDCPDDKKCCINRCGQECLGPKLPDKPGTCPPHNVTSPCKKALGNDECNSDGNCPGGQKCCGPCVMACSDPARKYSIKLDGKVEIQDPDAVADPKIK